MRKDFIQQRFRRKNAANKDDENMDQQQLNKSPSPISNGNNSFLQSTNIDFLTSSALANISSTTGNSSPNIAAIQSLSSLINANSHLFNNAATATTNANGIGFHSKNEILDA